ncbi:ANTAR domain-containing response regulator [Kineococcus terrestris]|uniref:ANTAR domain-containing response regulator n=1 Tax=Kineococcus terrestris TaxID=2044856 RepID=UPI0034DB2D78
MHGGTHPTGTPGSLPYQDGAAGADGADGAPGPQDDPAALRAELEQLRTALTRRPVIDMAKGAVMAMTRCDEETAFRQLSQVSQQHNVKLFDLASALLADLREGERPPRRAAAPPGRSATPRELTRHYWTAPRAGQDPPR